MVLSQVNSAPGQLMDHRTYGAITEQQQQPEQPQQSQQQQQPPSRNDNGSFAGHYIIHASPDSSPLQITVYQILITALLHHLMNHLLRIPSVIGRSIPSFASCLSIDSRESINHLSTIYQPASPKGELWFCSYLFTVITPASYHVRQEVEPENHCSSEILQFHGDTHIFNIMSQFLNPSLQPPLA